ncbi:hypothetical protein ACC715_37030, partial [Rhizobium ruizarguesonis]
VSLWDLAAKEVGLPLHKLRESPLIAASRATDAMDQPDRFLPQDCGPCFMFEHGFDLGLIRQGMKESLNKAEPNVSRFADQFKSG